MWGNILLLIVSVLQICLIHGRDYSAREPVLAPPYYLTSIKVLEHYILPLLKYEENELEPYMDVATVKAHYRGHHDAYRKKMNAALGEWQKEEPENGLATAPLIEVMRHLVLVPEKHRTAITNNGGGFVNHAFWWGCISPNPNGTERKPEEQLMQDINTAFNSFDQFKELFTQKAMTLFGSGYVWLCRDGDALTMVTTSNQDCPLSRGLNPILVVDVWEHAYYLKHQYKRADYLKDWWMLVDWSDVAFLDEFWKKTDAVKPDNEEL